MDEKGPTKGCDVPYQPPDATTASAATVGPEERVLILPIQRTIQFCIVLGLFRYDIVQPMIFPFLSLATLLYVKAVATTNGYVISGDSLPAHQCRARRAFFDGCINGHIPYVAWLLSMQLIALTHGTGGEHRFTITCITVSMAITGYMLFLRSGLQEWLYLVGGPWRKAMQLMGVFVKLTREEISLLVDFVATGQAAGDQPDVELGTVAQKPERYTIFVPSIATFVFFYLIAILAAVENDIPLAFTRIGGVAYVFYILRSNGYYTSESGISETEYTFRKACEIGAYLGALGNLVWRLFLMYLVDWDSSYRPGFWATAPVQVIMSVGFAAMVMLCRSGREALSAAITTARQKSTDFWVFMGRVKRREASIAFDLKRKNSWNC
ncbi:hypothetical protein VHEMI05827 [[Torrubiella] hemipterigena]|uniref:Uncharacterized protein n=1 Tax=[Torrubiella] hemipterigena TaxID=1531966 RepID=A0A0A1SYX4_9HYPO|nr:hypothetical protein VHEMI05827 [[Torrubiella] hemipterigena]